MELGSVVETTSGFELPRAAAVTEVVSEGDVTVGAGLATAGAKEMTEAVFEVIGPRVVPEINRTTHTAAVCKDV